MQNVKCVGVTLIVLDLAIASRLSTKDEVWRQLLGENGIGFNNKARLAYVLGVIKKGTMQDLLCMHRIRNRFAHMPSPQFPGDELVQDIQELSTVGSKKGPVTEANYMDFYDKAVTKCEKALFSVFARPLKEKN